MGWVSQGGGRHSVTPMLMYLMLSCFWPALEASQLGPVKGRRGEGHPTMRRQDRLEPGIPFPWKLRTRRSYGLPHLCPSSSFSPRQLQG